jgi:hypothetical protein
MTLPRPLWTVAIAVIAGLLTFVGADRPVDRRRLASFASRHRVAVTAANAAHLVRYLAATRRWRVAGAVTALTVYTVDGLQHQSLGVHIGYGLSGWFAGALLAEARLAGPASPPSGYRGWAGGWAAPAPRPRAPCRFRPGDRPADRGCEPAQPGPAVRTGA